MSETKRCRHRTSWAFTFGGSSTVMLWCYRCGAIKNGFDRWVKPTGPNGDNPAMKGK